MNIIVVTFLVLTACCCCKGVWLETFHDDGVWKVPEDTLHQLTFSLRLNSTDFVHINPWSLQKAILEVTVVPDEDWKLDWVNRSVQFTGQEAKDEVNKSLVFSGYYWGRTVVSFYLTRNDLLPQTNHTLLRDDLVVSCGCLSSSWLMKHVKDG